MTGGRKDPNAVCPGYRRRTGITPPTGEPTQPAHWRRQLRGAHRNERSEQCIQEQFEAGAHIGQPQYKLGGRRTVTAPDIARQPRRDVCTIEDEIFGFGHWRTGKFAGSPTITWWR